MKCSAGEVEVALDPRPLTPDGSLECRAIAYDHDLTDIHQSTFQFAADRGIHQDQRAANSRSIQNNLREFGLDCIVASGFEMDMATHHDPIQVEQTADLGAAEIDLTDTSIGEVDVGEVGPEDLALLRHLRAHEQIRADSNPVHVEKTGQLGGVEVSRSVDFGVR